MLIDFGAFVDIGLKNDGLVHISKMSKQRIKHPLDVLSIGDIVEVNVIDVDLNKKMSKFKYDLGDDVYRIYALILCLCLVGCTQKKRYRGINSKGKF